MDFHISEESKKKLDMMIYGYVRTQKESEEKYRKELKEKQTRHFETYHFKSFDEMIDYIKEGKKIYTDKTFTDICCNYVEYKDGHILYWYSNDVVYNYTIEEFKNKMFFSILPGSTGYIDCWHKEN